MVRKKNEDNEANDNRGNNRQCCECPDLGQLLVPSASFEPDMFLHCDFF